MVSQIQDSLSHLPPWVTEERIVKEREREGGGGRERDRQTQTGRQAGRQTRQAGTQTDK